MRLAASIVGFIITAASAASAYRHGYPHAYPRERFDACGLCESYYDSLDRGYFDHDAEYNPYVSDYHGAEHRKSYHLHEARGLELREIIAEELVRRAEALTASQGYTGYNNRGLSRRELGQFMKRTDIPVKLSKSVKSDLKYKLASTWKDGKDPKQAHEEIARNHAKNVPGAVSATVTRAAHPSGSDANAVDHIQVVYHDKDGKAIPQDATHEAHHVPTGRENDGIDVKKLWEGHQADKDAKKAAKS